MSRKAKGARLVWRDRSHLGRNSFWAIQDGTTQLSCGTTDRQLAEEKLAAYIAEKYRPIGPISAQEMTVDTCLAIYGEEHAAHVAAPERIGYAFDPLLDFWGGRPVSDVKGNTCRAYAKNRITRFGKPASAGTIRRELNVLQAAINYCFKEGRLTSAAQVVLPTKPAPKERWLTREEAAWLLRAARNLRIDGRHLADFILCALYTGSRKQTILSLQIDTPSTTGGYVDTVHGLLYRKPIGKVGTKKQQGVARLPDHYLSYLRSLARNGRKYVVEDYQGRRIGDIKKAWEGACKLAVTMAARKGVTLDLGDISPHTLKHTAITWSLQRGAALWDAAGFFSTSVETLEKVYGHHSPTFQQSVLDAMKRKI